MTESSAMKAPQRLIPASADAVADFLEAARRYDVRHLGSVSLYTGLDSIGEPFLIVLENDAHHAAVFRKGCFDDLEQGAISPRAIRAAQLECNQLQWICDYAKRAQDLVPHLHGTRDIDPGRLECLHLLLGLTCDSKAVATPDWQSE